DKSRLGAFEKWRKESLEFLKQWPEGWAAPLPEVALKMKDANAAPETNFTVQADATVALTDKPRDSLKLSLALPPGRISAIRLEIVPQELPVEKRTPRK